MVSLTPAASGVRTSDLDFSDHRYVASRLIRRCVLEFRMASHPDAMTALAQLSEPTNQSRMVFIVGAARSGTTALQNALSVSPEIFMLGEANFFWENLRPGFRARYNARRYKFGLPASKIYECPQVAQEGATWVETVAALVSQYRFVGDKIPFGGYKEGRWPSEFLLFQHRHFRGAAYILMLRNPRDAILSPSSSWGVQNLVPWARSYIAAQRALIRLRLNFPRTVPVILETIGSAAFDAIQECLDCPLPQLSSMLIRREVSAREPEQVPRELRETVEGLETLYPMLCDAMVGAALQRGGSLLEKIDGHLVEFYRRLDPLHYSIEARWARLHSKVKTATRMVRDAMRETAYR